MKPLGTLEVSSCVHSTPSQTLASWGHSGSPTISFLLIFFSEPHPLVPLPLPVYVYSERFVSQALPPVAVCMFVCWEHRT